MAVLSYGPDPTDVVGRRVFAWLLDSFFAYVVAFVVAAAMGLFAIPEEVVDDETALTPYVNQIMFVVFAAVVFYWVVSVVTTALYGWSPGKLLLGVRIVCWDGNPPGFAKAAIRQVLFGFANNFGCLFWLPALAFAMRTRSGHRQPLDFAANTYVIDSAYQGRLIMMSGGAAHAGPASITAEEIAAHHALQGDPVVPPPGHKRTEPFFDKGRDTHVVFNVKRQAWLEFDKKDGSWNPIPGQEELPGSSAPGSFER